MFDHTFDATADGGRLSLSGDLVIQHAQELKRVLESVLAQGTHLSLDLSQVERADVSALQLLCAAQREANRQGGAITMMSPPSAGFRRTVVDAGFIDRCFSGTDNSGLWTGESD